MTRINNLGASRRLPPRLTLLASSSKYKFKEERKRILKLSVKKLRSIEDPEAFLSKSVLINNTLKRLQSEVREEKAKKAANVSYSPSPYSFYSIEKAYREEMERLDGNGNDSNNVTSALSEQDQHMFEADDEAESDDSKDSNDSNSSGSDSSDSDEESSDSKRSEVTSVVTSSPEDELLSEVYSPSMPPPPQLIASIDDERPATPVPWAKATPTHMDSNSNVSSIEAVIKTHESCDNELWSEAVRTECWTKPATPTPVSAPPTPVSATPASATPSRTTLSTSSTVNTSTWPNVDWPTDTPSTGTPTPVSATPTTATPSRTTLSTSSTVNTNTWPNVDWPTYTPSTGTPSTGTPSTASSFNPNISAPTCNSHKENLFIATPTSSNVAPPTPVDSKTLSDSKCYSCGQSSLFQSELQSVVFNSLIASLET